MRTQNILIVLTSVLFFLLSGCLQNKSSNSSEEVRSIISSGGSGNSSLNPSLSNWPLLGSICSNTNNTQAEELVCQLDEILEEVAQSGRPLSDFEPEINAWIQKAIDFRNLICHNNVDELSFLLEGTMQVLGARGLVTLPFNNGSVVSHSNIHDLVRKILKMVVFETINLGCNINQQKIPSIFAGNNLNPSPGSGVGSPSPVNPSPGNGGGTVVPNPPGSSVSVCSILQLKFTYYCKQASTFNAVACDDVKQHCLQNSCNCI